MKQIIFLLFFSISITLFAQDNPFIKHMYTADPSAHVWEDGRLYVYASHDIAPPRGCDLMDQYHVFSTDDMVNWTDHGEILRASQVPWSKPLSNDAKFMWAPDCAYKNGKYYFYFPHPSQDPWNSNWKIGVAVSDKPASGFKVLEHHLLGLPERGHIDPCVFVDDDGQAYFYYGGGGKCYGAKLKDNMYEIDGTLQQITGLVDFHEAAWVHKRDGLYYLSYSDNHDEKNDKEGVKGDNRMRYATAQSPLGPWEYQGIYMDPTDSYTNHGSIVEYKGQWYAFYHNSQLSRENGETNDWLRSICVDKLYYNHDGTIKKVVQTGNSFIKNAGKSYERTASGIKANLQSMQIEIQFVTPEIVHIYKIPEDNSIPSKNSLSVTKTQEEVSLEINQQNDVVCLKSESLQVSLNMLTGKITFFDLNSSNLLTEKDYGAQFTRFNDAGNQTYRIRQAFLLEDEEAIYGLGQHQNGKMNQRDQRITLRQENMQICIPFIQSMKGYGLFWDNYSPTTFQDNPQEMSWESTGFCVDYYFLYGENADGVISQMRKLTGQVPMFPLWTFGFLQSRERYTGQEETLDVVKKYRNLQIPLDGIVQDWQYWGVNNADWNSTEFGNPSFPNPKKMVEDVHALNAHILISVWPSFGPNTKIFKEFSDKGMLLGYETYPPREGVKVYDAFNPKARDIYWSYLNKNLFSLGIDGWWLDATEPEHQSVKESDFTLKTHMGTVRSVYNAYPLMSVGGVYDHQRAVTDAKRAFILTRSAFAGQQRYATTAWSGDVDADWHVLRNQISGGLNFSLCGIPYWNTDIGGFFVRDNFKGGLKNQAYHELYVRWMQFAVFTTLMRSHGTSIPREIYQFGKKGDWSYDVQEKYIKFRYKLLPYLYSTAWDVTKNGSSFMRALFMDFNEDSKIHNINNQYMFGKAFLVAPVTEPSVNEHTIYLPKDTEWIDFWTGEKLLGGRNIKKKTPIDIIPLYVKAGSIVPFGPDVQYATEKKWDNLEIRIYPGADGEFILYEDENDNYNYEKGKYSVISFQWNDTEKKLIVGERIGSYSGMLKSRKFNIILVDEKNGIGMDLSRKKDKIISYNGKKTVIGFGK
jgi:alpha-D-xyloside xylohydrolase